MRRVRIVPAFLAAVDLTKARSRVDSGLSPWWMFWIAFALVTLGPIVLFYGLDFRLFNNGAGGTCWDMKYSLQHGTDNDPLFRFARFAPLLSGGFTYLALVSVGAERRESRWRFVSSVPAAILVAVAVYMVTFAGTFFVDYCTS